MPDRSPQERFSKADRENPQILKRMSELDLSSESTARATVLDTESCQAAEALLRRLREQLTLSVPLGMGRGGAEIAAGRAGKTRELALKTEPAENAVGQAGAKGVKRMAPPEPPPRPGRAFSTDVRAWRKARKERRQNKADAKNGLGPEPGRQVTLTQEYAQRIRQADEKEKLRQARKAAVVAKDEAEGLPVGPVEEKDGEDVIVDLWRKYDVAVTQKQKEWIAEAAAKRGLTENEFVRLLTLGSGTLVWSREHPPIEDEPWGKKAQIDVTYWDDEWDKLEERRALAQPAVTDFAAAISWSEYHRLCALGVIKAPRLRGEGPPRLLMTQEEQELCELARKFWDLMAWSRLPSMSLRSSLAAAARSVRWRVRMEGYQDPGGELAELRRELDKLVGEGESGVLPPPLLEWWLFRLTKLRGTWLTGPSAEWG